MRIALGLSLAAYPLLVYLLLDTVPLIFIIAALGVLFLFRLVLIKRLPPKLVAAGGAAIMLFCGVAYADPGMRVLKMYPVLMNLAIACFGVYTLLNPPSAIERLSRTIGMAVEGPAIAYTRTLTMVWVAFFVVSACIAAYTALAAPTSIWALYNGLVSYLLIGFLIAAEYPVRLQYRKRHGHLGRDPT